eukprot:TRINITY_DN1888_c0_g1_i1.p1 TRINITY_DN1888_c0_g1~~TRINITY_DN1888_c0_g1_i1.p1  ORF type:complete len:274 (+),score=48.40 TRINITY_DN1888_c0_g1_i1:112-822(+)
MKKEGLPLSELVGSTIVFGKRNGIDSKGRLVLNSKDMSSWLSTLQSYSSQNSSLYIKNGKARAQKEQEVAQLLGVSKFYCEPDLENCYSYDELLKNILKQLTQQSQNDFSNLKIRICDNEQPEGEPSTGTITIPVKYSTHHLLQVINQYGKETLKQFGNFKYAVEQLKNVLSLSSLTYQVPPELSADQLWECLERLAKTHRLYIPYLRGVKLHISNDYGLNEEYNVLSIKWDYLID